LYGTGRPSLCALLIIIPVCSSLLTGMRLRSFQSLWRPSPILPADVGPIFPCLRPRGVYLRLGVRRFRHRLHRGAHGRDLYRCHLQYACVSPIGAFHSAGSGAQSIADNITHSCATSVHRPLWITRKASQLEVDRCPVRKIANEIANGEGIKLRQLTSIHPNRCLINDILGQSQWHSRPRPSSSKTLSHSRNGARCRPT
jgi:hypothetical protein